MPKRVTMNISLPPAARTWIADRVSEGQYASASEYVRDLVRQDRERLARIAVDTKLEKALDSPDAGELTAADFERIRAEVRRRVGRRKRSTG